MTSLRFGPPGTIASEASIPGDKSISHRALLLSACASGTTTITGINRGEDVMATMRALRPLRISVNDESTAVRVKGGDFYGTNGRIECGNSGTTMRLLMGALAGRSTCTLDGDSSLRRRPMERVAEPLRLMGASIRTSSSADEDPKSIGVPPVFLWDRANLRGIDYVQPVASAQVKSAILLAGLRAGGTTTVRSPYPSRDHTERMLTAMGARLQIEGHATSIQPGPLRALEEYSVPGDPSAAIFFLVAASPMRHAEFTIRDVCVNPTRIGAFHVMRAMRARLHIGPERERNNEPVASLTIEGGAKLHSTTITPDLVPNLIDEIPALCALAAIAKGDFVVNGAAELRVKESDRIASTARMLRAFGAHASETDDGIIVRGGSKLRAPTPIDTAGDHRIGMAAAALAVAIGAPIEIVNAGCIDTSFPDFASTWSEAFGAPFSIFD